MSNILFNCIVCTDSDGGISQSGKIPWKIKEDYNFFKDTITNNYKNNKNIILMGKNTFRSMGIIKNNINIIISTTLKAFETNDDVYIFQTIDEGIKFIETIQTNNIKNVFICGGKRIYDFFFEKEYKFNIFVYWTLIHKKYNCDNFIDISKLHELTHNNNIYNFNCNDEIISEYVNITISKPKLITLNNEENQYLALMESILKNGKFVKSRNGNTYSKFGNILRFNLETFPLLTTKKMFLRGIFEELIYFIRGDTNTKHLSDKGVKIWEKNTTAEFIKKCNLPYEEYDMGPMYGFQWRYFNAKYDGIKSNYDGKGVDQLKFVLNELKHNPHSRRILMTTYNPAQAHEGVLFPCHGIAIQFNVEHICDNKYKLNISQNQRSCDYFLGVPFNISSYSLLNYMICHILNNDAECIYKYEPGELVMFLGDYHIYSQHTTQAIQQILRTPKKFPKLFFKRDVFHIEDFVFEDIDLVGYDPLNTIHADMIA